MKKIIILASAILLNSTMLWAQISRDKEFHDKYTLSEVAIFSRHNIRAPLADTGSFLSTITPHKWYDFGVSAKELTMKGGVLETINGQFFHQWVVSEGLFPENAIPTDEEVVFVANSKQRTISTARHFATSFMPMKTINVHHEGKIGDTDPLFDLSLGTDITEAEWAQIRQETAERYTSETLRKCSESLKPNYNLLSDVLDLKNSPAYLDGSFTGFNDHNTEIVYALNKEPQVTASMNQAVQPTDALVLQYYEETDPQKEAFGKTLTAEQWQAIYQIIHVHDIIRFCSPWINRHVSKAQRKFIADALINPARKFTFLCGHDTNILNILKALRTKEYTTINAIEIGTPISSKIVFEKWVDASGNAFVAVNHVYQSVEQMRNSIMLNKNTQPTIIPLQFEDMTPNSDGLYPLDAMIDRLTDKDVPATIKSTSERMMQKSDRAYSLSGLPATDSYHGVVIQNGAKIFNAGS